MSDKYLFGIIKLGLAMDILAFVASVIGSLAWPVTVLIALFLLRKQLIELIPGIRRLKYKDFEVDFGKELQKIEEKVRTIEAPPPTKMQLPADVQPEPLPKTQDELRERLAALSPNAAILESWRNVERTLDFYFKSRSIERPQSGQAVAGHLDYDPNFPPQLVSAYQELRLLRNRAAHDREDLTADHAKKFSALADKLTYALIEAAHR